MTRVVKRWTLADDAEVIKLAEHKTHTEIAEIIGRTLSATKKRVSQLSLLAKSDKPEPEPKQKYVKKRDALNLIGVSKRIHDAMLEHGPMTASQASKIIGVSDKLASQTIGRHRKLNGSQGFYVSGVVHETSGFFAVRLIYSAGPGEDVLTLDAKPEIIHDNLNPFDRVFRSR